MNDIAVNSERFHWVWYSFLLLAAAFIITAVLFDPEFIETWFSKDHQLKEYTRNVLTIYRLALVVLAGCCIILWSLRKCIYSDWQAVNLRLRTIPSHVSPAEIMPTNEWAKLNTILWLLLPVWTVFVTVCLIPGNDRWSGHLVIEHGPFENLTVACYLFSAFISLKLLISHHRGNARRGFFRWWLIGIALCCLIIAGEETNWLEVYFQYDFGSMIRKANYQDSVSLHNIWLPIAGGHYWANDLHHIIAAGGGILIPFLIRFSNMFRRWMLALEVPVPPWISQAYFFVAAIIPPEWLLILEHRLNLPSEMREFTFALGVAVWLWHTMQNHPKRSTQFKYLPVVNKYKSTLAIN